MCELVEEYAKNYAEEVKKAVSETEIKTAINFLKNGVSVELVVKSLPSFLPCQSSLSENFRRSFCKDWIK